MDGDSGQSGQNMYKPEDVVVPDKVAAASSTPVQPSTPAQFVGTPGAAEQPIADNADPHAIRWTASEFIAHSKTTGWYALLGVATVLIAALIWFLTTDLFATVTVAAGIILLGVYAGRQPREEQYMLDSHGITIGPRHYSFAEFRSFSVRPEGAFMSIELTPLKRVAMYTTVYCAPADEDKIITLLSAYLPMEEARANLTDSLMRRLHF